MGSVYLARDERQAGAHRYAAVKIIHPHLAEQQDFVAMFLDEADIASRLVHPNVVRAYDYGAYAQTPYLAMEYLRGEPLTRVFQTLSEHASVEQHAGFVARVVADACEGVHAAHELRDEDGASLDVVHRDVSPQNVFVTYDGVVKVVDFGTVKARGQRHRTRTGFIKGKCAYVAPEILLAKRFDRRADVWSLGVLLWELLTRKRLFARDIDAQTLRAVLEHRPIAPSRADRSLPSAYDAVVMTALRRDPKDRYPTAREFRRALERALVAHGELVDLGDLAQWMDAIFPCGRAQHRDTLRLAEGSSSEAPTQLYCGSDRRSVSTRLSRCTDPFAAAVSHDVARDTSASRNFHLALSVAAMAVATICLVLVAVLQLSESPRARDGVAIVSMSTGTAAIGSAPPRAAPITQTAAAPPPSPYSLELWTRTGDGQRVLVWERAVDAAPTKLVTRTVTPRPRGPWYPTDI
jgi:serine/threonine-protein kinase